MRNSKIRPVGEIKIFDERGYAYIPDLIRSEVGVEGKGGIPYFINANTVLLVRKGASLESILKSLDVLKEDLKLRAEGSIITWDEGSVRHPSRKAPFRLPPRNRARVKNE